MAKNAVLSRGDWVKAVAFYLLLVLLVSALPVTPDSDQPTPWHVELITTYEIAASFAVMLAAVFGCFMGRCYTDRRLILWVASVAASLPLGLWASIRLTEAGYPPQHRKIVIMTIVLCGLLVLPLRREDQTEDS